MVTNIREKGFKFISIAVEVKQIKKYINRITPVPSKPDVN